jgi:hypothetical protein
MITKTKLKRHFIPNTPLPWIQKALMLQGNVNAAKLALYIWYVKGLKANKNRYCYFQFYSKGYFWC